MTVNTVTVCGGWQWMDGDELSLDELAERSGVSARTIRYYQSEGVLAAPRREGREARYNAGHLERLELVAELQERGLKLEAIRSLLDRAGKRATSVNRVAGNRRGAPRELDRRSGRDDDARRGARTSGQATSPARR